VSGAPKIKAIEIISSLEKERRGVYAGAVGRFDFADDEMDTCIAIRTMVFKDGVAYLQAGGGIVYDSVEEDEYQETINKLGGNVRALEQAESKLSFFASSCLLNSQSRALASNPATASTEEGCSCVGCPARPSFARNTKCIDIN